MMEGLALIGIVAYFKWRTATKGSRIGKAPERKGYKKLSREAFGMRDRYHPSEYNLDVDEIVHRVTSSVEIPQFKGSVPFGKDLRRLLFSGLSSSLAMLNHGSYGACMTPVRDVTNTWRRHLEENPVRFFESEATPLMYRNLRALASFIGNTSLENHSCI